MFTSLVLSCLMLTPLAGDLTSNVISVAPDMSYVNKHMSAEINIKDFGAKGDGVSDDTKAIQQALDKAEAAGGGLVIVPASARGYALYDNVMIGNNTTLKWTGPGYFRLKKGSKTGAVLTVKSVINKSITSNIQILNPYIDANNIKNAKYGENGIGIANAENVKIVGGVINGARMSTTFGGKGVCIELGARNCNISGLTIRNSDIAFFIHGVNGKDKLNRRQTADNINLANVKVSNCGTFLHFLCSYDPPPVDSNITKCTVNGFTVTNSGKRNGVIVLDRYSFIDIRNGKIVNSAKYGLVDAFVRGRAANFTMENVVFNGNAATLVSTEIIPRGGRKIGAVNWDISGITVVGKVGNVIASGENNVWKNTKLKNIDLGTTLPAFEKKAAQTQARSAQSVQATKKPNHISLKGKKYFLTEVDL